MCFWKYRILYILPMYSKNCLFFTLAPHWRPWRYTFFMNDISIHLEAKTSFFLGPIKILLCFQPTLNVFQLLKIPLKCFFTSRMDLSNLIWDLFLTKCVPEVLDFYIHFRSTWEKLELTRAEKSLFSVHKLDLLETSMFF